MNRNRPPTWILRFFRWYAHPRLRDHIEGDLMEVYHENRINDGKRTADLKFMADVILLCRPGIIRPLGENQKINTYGMYQNYVKLSVRQLAKNKSFTFINLFGLTLGFLSFMLLALYIEDELSYDRFHQDADRIFRVIQHEKQQDGSIRDKAPVAFLIGKEVSQAYPEIESFTRVTALGRLTLGNDPTNRSYHSLISVDDNFFRFFDFPLLEGTADDVLKNPDAVVLSETLARKYFGDGPVVGKRIWSAMNRNGKPVEFTVSGVMKDFPSNSHLQFEALFSESTWKGQFNWYQEFSVTDWTSNTYVTYLKVKESGNPSSLGTRIGDLVKSHYPADRPYQSEFSLQPLDKIHLYSEDVEGTGRTASGGGMKPVYLYMLGIAGALLMIIACLNYTNLATAAAIRRTREMGVRKSLGAPKGQLVIQFLSDSIMISTIAFLVSIALLYLVLPLVSAFTEKKLIIDQLPLTWFGFIIGCILLTALIASIYPSIVSIGIPAAKALKGEIRAVNQKLSMRKGLLAVQFSISIAMIATTLVIYSQLKFMREIDLGVNVESLLVIDINSRSLRDNFESVKAEFASPAEVLSITTSTRVPGEWKSFPIAQVKSTGDSRTSDMIYVGIDNDFLKTYNIQLKEGRNFNAGRSDSMKVILTESGVKELGLTNPVGQMIEIPTVRFGAQEETLEKIFTAEVVGVVADFHFESLRRTMRPVIFAAPNTVIQRIDYYTLKVKTSDWNKTLAQLRATNERIDPNNPIEYTFLDNRFAEFYKADAVRGQIFLFFSILIVCVTCMGLFALVSYSLESRTKEIGVRKVLGASIGSIIGLVSREFLLLVIVGGLIGIPAAWYFMQGWLGEFAYRISPGIGLFLSSLAIALFIALATVAARTLGAARENPVKSLRSE